MLHIGFDLDGTIMQSYSVLRGGLLLKYGVDIYEDQYQHMISINGVEREELKKDIARILYEYCDFCHPYPDTVEMIEKIYFSFSYPLISIVTARENWLYKSTYHWLKKHMLVPFKLFFKKTKEKKDFLNEMGIDVWIDDRLKIANECAGHIPYVFLLKRQWNMGRYVDPGVFHVNDLQDVYEILK